MYHRNTLALTYALDSSHDGKDIARMIVDRTPIFHLRVDNGNLYKADPVLMEIPRSVRTVEEATSWLVAHPSRNAAEIAYRKDMFAIRGTHAFADGGHWASTLTHFDAPPKAPPRAYVYTNDELFGKYLATFDRPCSLDLPRDGFVVQPSYPPKETAEVIDVVHQVSQDVFACYDSKNKRPTKLTEHSWVSMLMAGLVHNWRRTGKLDFSKSGVITLVNLRPWVDPAIDIRCVGNCFSRLVPTAGGFHLDETLEAVAARLRGSLRRQLNDMEQIKVLKAPLKGVPGAPLMLSVARWAQMPGFIRDGYVREIVQNLRPRDSSEWSFLLTHTSCSFADRTPHHWILMHANKVVLSECDISNLRRLCMRGLRSLSLDMTVLQALQKIEPDIKRAI
jgi:hypothetical protein